ncbi:MAG: HK97 family phage prohead protease [Mesorhizobium amorphae]|nr:MAG: HK97 family phage prohead protease [Mesorhizobium amorphae]
MDEPLERKRAEVALDRIGSDGTFAGYASLFHVADLGRDVVEPGAFRRSLDKRGASGVRMLFQHDPAQPIGTWLELKEDRRGLFVRGRLATGAAKAREVLSLMEAGAVDGLSIGFRTVRAAPDKGRGLRRILEADLWEISIVTFPMQPDARVTALKARPRVRMPPGTPSLAVVIRRAAKIINPKG